MKENNISLTIVTAIAIFLVWCLFAVVAIVYLEVILKDNEATSECPGRVEAKSNIDDQTRTLSIIYQSIVIVFTFFLAIVFFYSSWCLFRLTQKGLFFLFSFIKNKQKQNSSLTNNLIETQASTFVFRLGAILVTAFVAWCILFMILLAMDFTSAVYLFCTLFFTEVSVYTFVFLIHYYPSLP